MDLLEVAWLFMAGVLGVALALVPFGIGALVRRLRHPHIHTRKETPAKRGLRGAHEELRGISPRAPKRAH
jgi:hypothetical protein